MISFFSCSSLTQNNHLNKDFRHGNSVDSWKKWLYLGFQCFKKAVYLSVKESLINWLILILYFPDSFSTFFHLDASPFGEDTCISKFIYWSSLIFVHSWCNSDKVQLAVSPNQMIIHYLNLIQLYESHYTQSLRLE
jgi:hypothetical protein